MTYMRNLIALGFTLGLGLAPLDTALADKRVALLIGNSSYSGVTRLENPARDVEMLSASFTSAGFDKVETRMDLDRDAMVSTLRAFEDEAASADIAVIYFSGHGLEMNGENFLVPVDAKLASDRDVEDETVTLTRMLRTVDGAKRLKLIILDACRNNPFLANMKLARSIKSISRGLAEVEPRSADTLIAYAAKAGTVAWDGSSGSSPFALALSKRIMEPGVDIRLALGKVRDDVLKTTNRLQEPFAYGSLGGDTVTLAKLTVPGPATATDAPASPVIPVIGKADPCADAAAHFAEASKFNRVEFYKDHLDRFGSCAFSDFAKAKLLELENQKVAALPPAAVEAKSPRQNAVKSAAPAKKATLKRTKSVKPAKPAKPVQQADEEYAMAREPVATREPVMMEPAPRRRPGPTIMFGFGRGGGIGFGGGGGGGGIGLGF